MTTKQNKISNVENQIRGIIKLNGQQINNQHVSCTGSQLANILEASVEIVGETKWVITDISTNNGFIPKIVNCNKITYIERTKELIDFSLQIDQFWSGIFLSFYKEIPQLDLNRKFDTEDKTPKDLGDAILEIRAFDSTYFEICSSDVSLLKILSQKYNVKIETIDV